MLVLLESPKEDELSFCLPGLPCWELDACNVLPCWAAYRCCCWESFAFASLNLNGKSCDTVSGLARFATVVVPVPDVRSPDGDIPEELDDNPDIFFFDIRSLPPIDDNLLVETVPLVDTESLDTSFSGIFCCISCFSNPTTECFVSFVALNK